MLLKQLKYKYGLIGDLLLVNSNNRLTVCQKRINNNINNNKVVIVVLRQQGLSTTTTASAGELLTVSKSKRLMRLIYARVHPDLFTNYLQAQKENENSLKKLRNLLDCYIDVNQSSIFSHSSHYQQQQQQQHSSDNNQISNNDLIFYVKKGETHHNENSLKKIHIKNELSLKLKASSIQNRVENVLNQLIDELNIPEKKFKLTDSDSSRSVKNSPRENKFGSNARIRFEYGYDDDFDNFEQWSQNNENEMKIPDLENWLLNNKLVIEQKQQEARQIKEQLNANKNLLIKKWKLNNIIIKSNWSLKNFNAYLLALNSFNVTRETHFEGFTLVLSNSNFPGLRKTGHIHLNCGQVYEEWLNILVMSKKNAKLLEEIKDMEFDLSRLLKQIKICDPLDNLTFKYDVYDESILSMASYYHRQLNMILTNLTSTIGSIDNFQNLLGEDKFSNLQLTVQNVNTPKINHAGQFIIGASNRINFHNTIEFIKVNQEKSVNRFNDFLRCHETLQRAKEKLEAKLKATVSFETGLEMSQKIRCLQNLETFLSKEQDSNVDRNFLLVNSNLNISTFYNVNDNGSIDIPWNFKF